MTTTFIDDINDVLAQWAEGVISGIRQNLDSTGTTASGRTKESLRYVVDNGTLTIFGRPYFRSVEQGRGPGGIPYRFQDIIRQWMDDKGIASQFGETESQKRSAAYMIGQFIKSNGTKLYREGPRTDIYTDVIEEEMPKLSEQLAVTMQQSILRNI